VSKLLKVQSVYEHWNMYTRVSITSVESYFAIHILYRTKSGQS